MNTKEPKIPYRETINGDGAGDHKHKKQTGGRGQFAEVHLRIYPLSRDIKTQAAVRGASSPTRAGSRNCGACHYDPACNFAFIDHIVGGTIPNNFIPAVEKGCKEMLERGRPRRATASRTSRWRFTSGSITTWTRREAAFKTAARHAFRKAFLACAAALCSNRS